MIRQRLICRTVTVLLLLSSAVAAASNAATDGTSAASDDSNAESPITLELLALEEMAASAVVRVAGEPVPRRVEVGDVIEPLGWRVVAVHAERLVVRAPVQSADEPAPPTSGRLLWIHPRTEERPTWIQPVGLDAGARRGDPDTLMIPVPRSLDEGAFVVDLPERFRPESPPPAPR